MACGCLWFSQYMPAGMLGVCVYVGECVLCIEIGVCVYATAKISVVG